MDLMRPIEWKGSLPAIKGVERAGKVDVFYRVGQWDGAEETPRYLIAVSGSGAVIRSQYGGMADNHHYHRPMHPARHGIARIGHHWHRTVPLLPH